MARNWKSDVGEIALPAILDLLCDPELVEDVDMAKALLETFGNFMVAQRMQSQSNHAGDDLQRSSGLTRIMVGYLIVLATWLWESPSTTSEFLVEGTNLQVLIDPISQSSGVDPLVQGLCAFVLGILYETNRDAASSISRSALYHILHSRVGPDQFVNRILRLREDDRFKNVGLDVLELDRHLPIHPNPPLDASGEPDLWFDWPFVEFFKNNYLSIQQSILVDPGSDGVNVSSTENPRQNEIIAHLKKQLAEQSNDVNALERKVEELSAKLQDQSNKIAELESLRTSNAELDQEIQHLKQENSRLTLTHKENEKEQEDLLVLLEELTVKRRKDKALMREQNLQVSDDEDEGD